MIQDVPATVENQPTAIEWLLQQPNIRQRDGKKNQGTLADLIYHYP